MEHLEESTQAIQIEKRKIQLEIDGIAYGKRRAIEQEGKDEH